MPCEAIALQTFIAVVSYEAIVLLTFTTAVPYVLIDSTSCLRLSVFYTSASLSYLLPSAYCLFVSTSSSRRIISALCYIIIFTCVTVLAPRLIIFCNCCAAACFRLIAYYSEKNCFFYSKNPFFRSEKTLFLKLLCDRAPRIRYKATSIPDKATPKLPIA